MGVAEEDEIDRSKFVNEGDILIALPSSGLHSNGLEFLKENSLKRILEFLN